MVTGTLKLSKKEKFVSLVILEDDTLRFQRRWQLFVYVCMFVISSNCVQVGIHVNLQTYLFNFSVHFFLNLFICSENNNHNSDKGTST